MHPAEDRRRRSVRHEERRHLASLELVDHLSEPLVQGWLTRQADGHVRRVPRLKEPLTAHVRIPFVTRQQLALSADRFVDDEGRVVRGQERIRSPFLGAPAELASEIARIHGGGHLETAVTLDPIEGLLVASDAFREARLRPVAELHSAVLTDDAVTLALEAFLLLRVHLPRHDGAGLKGFRGVARLKARVPPSRSTQGEQFNLVRMKRKGPEQRTLRGDLFQAIEFRGEREISDLVAAASMAERSCDVRREDRFDPCAVDARDPPKHPPRVKVHELVNILEWDRFDSSQVTHSERGRKTKSIRSEGRIEDQRSTFREVHDDERHPPPSIHEREHMGARSESAKTMRRS